MTCAIFFNLDDTLTEQTSSYEEIYRKAVADAGLEQVEDAYDTYKSAFFNYFKNGRVYPRRQAMEDVTKDAGCYDGDKVEAFAEAWEEYEASSLTLRDGVREALEGMEGEYPLGIITNGTGRLQRLKLEKLGIADLFDSVIVSTEEGVRKPEPAIFEIAKDSVDAETYVLVSHLPKRDIVAARNAEFEAVWLSSTEKEVPEEFAVKISGFDELQDAVEDICG